VHSPATRRQREAPELLRARIEEFLAAAREPTFLEAGENPIPISQGGYSLEDKAGGCLLHVWGETGSVVRRITRLGDAGRSKLILRTSLFGGREGVVELVDRAASGSRVDREAGRDRFREQFRLLLERELPGWKLRRLSTAPDLQRSLSPIYPRALLTQGSRAVAAIAASPESGSIGAEHMLTFGLIWLDQLRAEHGRRVVSGLKLFVPRGRAETVARRLDCLDADAARFELYEFDPKRNVRLFEPGERGNRSSALPSCLAPAEPEGTMAETLRTLRASCDIEVVPRVDGLLSLRVRGIEFAEMSRGVLAFGLGEHRLAREKELPLVRKLAREIARLRRSDTPDAANPLYRSSSESWLESQIRRNPRALDSSLRLSPVYGQTGSTEGADRGIVDLLLLDSTNRLVVVEVKAGEDIHLPLQGLDYWARVRLHQQRGDFMRKGYFPGIEISPDAPRLVLVAPAIGFHPTTETLLRWLAPEIPVERVGLAADWRERIVVSFRKKGSTRPGLGPVDTSG